MKILIATKHLKNYAGSEIFTRDLIFLLHNRGHEVSVFSKELGSISDEISQSGIPVTDNLNDYLEKKFDVIHAQHSTTTILARSFFPDIPIVFLSHGIISDFEKLPKIDLGISFYLGVSEEVISNFYKNNSIDPNKIKIIRNFIDTKKFISTKPLNEKPEKLLVLSNHYVASVKDTIEAACGNLEIEVIHIGMPENPQKDVAGFINESDIVVSLGRGVLEAMSCERNVIIYDWNGGDGFVDENNFYKAREKNFSGRVMKKQYSEQEFKEEILKYDPNLGNKLRKIILLEHSSQEALFFFEKIYKDARGGSKVICDKNLVSRIILNKKITPLYVALIMFANRIKKVMRIVGLRKF